MNLGSTGAAAARAKHPEIAAPGPWQRVHRPWAVQRQQPSLLQEEEQKPLVSAPQQQPEEEEAPMVVGPFPSLLHN